MKVWRFRRVIANFYKDGVLLHPLAMHALLVEACNQWLAKKADEFCSSEHSQDSANALKMNELRRNRFDYLITEEGTIEKIALAQNAAQLPVPHAFGYFRQQNLRQTVLHYSPDTPFYPFPDADRQD